MSGREKTKAKRGKHQCVPKEMAKWIQNVEKNPHVKKIILGIAQNARHRYSPGTAKFKSYTESGVLFRVYTGNGVREIFIITEKPKKVRKEIQGGN